MNSAKINIEDLVENYDKHKHYITIKTNLEDGTEKLDIYVYPSSYCDVCEMPVHKYGIYQHRKSKHHKIKAGLMNYDDVFKPNILYCETCDLHFKTKEIYYQHIKKVSHKKALEIENRLKQKLLKNDS